MRKYRGRKRPDFAAEPTPGQESVWDYPRPPKLAPDERLVEVYYGDQAVASSNETYRVLETASPPSFLCTTDEKPDADDLIRKVMNAQHKRPHCLYS